MEYLDSGQLTRRVIILLYLSGGATIQTATPNKTKNSHGSWSVFVMNGGNPIMEVYEDELDFLLEDKLIENTSGSGEDPDLNFWYETYTITDTAWSRFKTIREKILKKQRTAHS